MLSSEAFSKVIVDRVVAVVGNEPILQSEIAKSAKDKGQQTDDNQILEELIAEKLIMQKLQKLNLEVKEEEIEQAQKSVMQQYNLKEASFAQALQGQGLSLDEYRAQLKKQLYRMKLVQAEIKKRVEISEDDLRQAYQNQYGSDEGSLKIKADYLLFKSKTKISKKKAQDAYEILAAKREDFIELSIRLSTDKDVLKGSFGEVAKGELLANFEKPIFLLAEGSFTKPIETNDGYFIVYVSKRSYVEKVPFEKVKKELHDQLHTSEIERAFTRYVEELKKEAYIERFK